MIQELAGALRGPGFAFVAGDALRAQLGALPDWDAFAASWDDLAVDPYVAGRDRRRRYARFAIEAGGAIARAPHGPHFQRPEYNPLYGGIERWFEPVRDAVAASASLGAILGFARAVFEQLEPPPWDVELHQFRIEARPGAAGHPTPEGPHRDGVDYVLVLLIRRHNIASGTTTIHAPDGRALGSFTLAAPLDAAVVHDPRVYHGVTPVVAVDPSEPAHRDVLVVTFRRRASVAP